MADSIKYNYMDFKFTIFVKNSKWWLDFYYNKKRIKRTTKLTASTQNFVIVKKEIIPSVVEYLTGEIQYIQEQKEYTLKSLADDYFTIHKKEVREQTHRRNLFTYNKHILPYFGHRILSSIKPMELEQWQFKLLDIYRVGTVQAYRTILYSIFEMALRNDILDKNPLSRVKSPRSNKKLNTINSEINKVEPFTKKEIDILILNANGYMKNFIQLMYSSGLRPGEIVSLSWEDINIEKKQISITKTMVNGKLGDPKTISSIRRVDILPLMHKALENQRKLTQGKSFIFMNKFDKPFYSHDIINLNFKKILEQNNIKARKLYNLRHTFASQLISNGADIVWVSKMMGHKDVSITLNTYTKYIIENDDIRFKKIEQMGTILGTD